MLDGDRPYSPLGYPASGYPARHATALGVQVEARPSLNEVLVARTSRQAVVSRVLGELPDSGLSRVSAPPPAPGYPDGTRTVGRCLRVVLQEECEHLRYAVRDIAVLEARG